MALVSDTTTICWALTPVVLMDGDIISCEATVRACKAYPSWTRPHVPETKARGVKPEERGRLGAARTSRGKRNVGASNETESFMAA